MEWYMRSNTTCPKCAGIIKFRGEYYECMDCRTIFLVTDEGMADTELKCVEKATIVTDNENIQQIYEKETQK